MDQTKQIMPPVYPRNVRAESQGHRARPARPSLCATSHRHLPLSPSPSRVPCILSKGGQGKWRWRGGREGCSHLDTALGCLAVPGWDECRPTAEMAIGDAGEGYLEGQGRRQTVDGTADLRPGRAVGELSIDHLSVGSCRPPDSLPSQTQIA